MSIEVSILLLLLIPVVVGIVNWIDVKAERRQIERFLRVGGARIESFRWKPFLGFGGADNKSKHYQIEFCEHNGQKFIAIFTYTSGIGVMMTQKREVE